MKQKLHYYILIISILFTNLSFAQDYTDYLVDENNTKIFCKIIQIKNGKVKYRLKGKSYSTIKAITKFSDVSFANPDVLKNPLGLKIEKPEPGFAHVYFYYSGTIYNVRYNAKKLIKIRIGNYFLHKIKASEIHNYLSSGSKLKIIAENQKIYLVRGTETITETGINSQITAKLVLDNRKVSEYALLSMKKKAE
jgi:hypothetical protein